MHVFDTKDKTLVYKALSYCWGSEDSLLDVLVNGWSFQVTKNVFSFLSHTAVMKDNRCDWWFIDAICINQQDLSERSMQVSLMSDIYRNAAQVCIWLTDLEYDDYCDDVEHGESLDEDYYAMLKAESTGLWPDGTTATAEDIRACDAKLASVAGGLISQSRYWLRLWIVQEVIMAKKLMVQWRHYMWRGAVLNDLTFKYLPDMFGQLDSLVALNGIPLSPAVLFAGQARDALLAHVMCATVMQTKMLWGHFIRSGGFLPFYKVLSSFGAQSCSMIHDHIIGLLAMMNICVRPDYSMTSTQLLTVMVREFLVSMGFGRMLVHHNELGRADPKYLANLGTIIRSVLLFPLDNPVVMLVILEVIAHYEPYEKAYGIYLTISGHYIPSTSKWYQKTKLWPRVDSWRAQRRRNKALAILTAAKRTDSLLVAPGVERETKSYSDWKHTVREICAELDRRTITNATNLHV